MTISRSRLGVWGGWGALALSVSIYATVSLLLHQPFHAGGLALRSFDLRIYHLGALRVTHGTPLYRTPMLHHLGFTYPPFAAVLLTPLAWIPFRVDTLLVTALNLGLLIVTLRRALILASGRPAAERRLPGLASPGLAWSLAACLGGVALWLEPVSVTLGYGQINLLIVALVICDLSRPDSARTKGVAIGLAAAIKLTPLVFIAYLLFSQRGRAAWIAAATFVASIAVSLVLLPGDASTYWSGTFLSTSRVGSVAAPVNQSLLGMIARLTGTAHPGAGWEVLIATIALGGVALATRASRHGDEAAGFSLAALSTLLASPISWNHHWTLAVPALILLGRRAYEQRSAALAATTGLLTLVALAYLPEIAESQFRTTRGLASLASDPYPLIGLLVLATCATARARSRVRAPQIRVHIPSLGSLTPLHARRHLTHGVPS